MKKIVIVDGGRRMAEQQELRLWDKEKKFRLFLFLFGDCQKLSKLWGYFAQSNP